MAAKKTQAKEKAKRKFMPIPTALSQAQLDDIDTIAKAEGLSRSEVIRRAVEAFASNYKTDQLDQRQIQLEKRMKTMETALRALLVKSIRLNGQVLYFAVLPYTHGLPKQKLSAKGFQLLYEKSAHFASQFLESKATSKLPKDLDFAEQEGAGDEQGSEKSE
jgi:hypothetical protein